jgi:predicted ATPase
MSEPFSRQFLRRVDLLRDQVPSFDEYPFNLPIVRTLEALDFHPAVTFIVGENGSGKSTLLEAIAIALGFNAEGGSRNFRFRTRATHAKLHKFLHLSRGISRPRTGYFFRAESFYNLASEVDRLNKIPSEGEHPLILQYGGKSLHEQSHGESFFSLLMHRFYKDGLYVLDEPEAALSPQRQLAAVRRIHDLVGARCQFIIATHSPILMAYPNSWIYQIGPTGLLPVAYTDTEHYRVSRAFLTHHEQMLQELLKD